MSFYNELEKRKLLQYMYCNNFKKIVPKGGREFVSAIQDIISNNYSVYMDEDCDIDGYLSVLSLKTMFDVLGHGNYYIPTHVYKRHGVGIDYIEALLRENKFKYYIITDSSSNATEVFDLFLNHPEVKCICIDHHVCSTDRSKYRNTNVLIINPKLDSLEKGEEVLSNELSACAVISLLIDCTLKMAFKDKYDDMKGAHWVYGYITLYSDSCKFTWYNIAYAQWVTNSHFPYPPLVDVFMDKYSTLNKNFVSWKLAPRLNAILRAEYFSLAYDLFYNTKNIVDEGTVKEIEDIYQESRKFVTYLVNTSTLVEKENMVIGYLPDIARARNYTGLVASELSGRHNKPAMVLLSTSQDNYEGSVRDIYSRNLLQIFKSVTYADGHPPAFGVKINKDTLEDTLYLLDNRLNSVRSSEGVILLDWGCYSSRDKELHEDLQLMSEYNEYSGQGLPVAYAKLPIRANMRLKHGSKVTRIQWGNIEMLLFGRYISEGDTAIVEPTHPGKLIVKNVHYGY